MCADGGKNAVFMRQSLGGSVNSARTVRAASRSSPLAIMRRACCRPASRSTSRSSTMSSRASSRRSTPPSPPRRATSPPARSRPTMPARWVEALPQGQWRSDLHGRRPAGAGQAGRRQGARARSRSPAYVDVDLFFPLFRPVRRAARAQHLGRRLCRQEGRDRHDARRDRLDGEDRQDRQDRRSQGRRGECGHDDAGRTGSEEPARPRGARALCRQASIPALLPTTSTPRSRASSDLPPASDDPSSAARRTSDCRPFDTSLKVDAAFARRQLRDRAQGQGRQARFQRRRPRHGSQEQERQEILCPGEPRRQADGAG